MFGCYYSPQTPNKKYFGQLQLWRHLVACLMCVFFFWQTKTRYPFNFSAIYFLISVLAFAPMKSDLLPVRLERALPVLASRGPRVVTCAACVCPARPAAVEDSRPPSGCYPQWSRTSVVCTSSPSRSPRSGSQRSLSPGQTEGGAAENLREPATISVLRAAHLQLLASLNILFY